MSDKHTLFAFIAMLVAICYLATVAAILAWQGRYAEALGFGGLTTGLVGVLGTFKPRTLVTGTQDVNVVNPVDEAIPVETQEKGQ